MFVQFSILNKISTSFDSLIWQLIKNKEEKELNFSSKIVVHYYKYVDTVSYIILDNILNIILTYFVFLKHRYYGKSIPFGSMEEAMKNESIRGYFNSAQAIADYAEVLLHIKEKLSAQDSPIIVIGGSYGGSKQIMNYSIPSSIYFN